MLTSHSRIRRDERGVGMVTALIITLVVFATGAVWAQNAVHQVESSGLERSREQALAAAEAGLNAAMSRLSTNPQDCSSFSGSLSGVGDYDVSFPATVDCTNTSPSYPYKDIRFVTAKGYSPSRTAPRSSRRQLEQQVELITTDGFKFALFASPGGVTGMNSGVVTGDAYSRANLSLTNTMRVNGALTTLGSVTLSNSATVTGRIHAGTTVLLDGPSTSGGEAWTSAGSINGTGKITGNAQSASTIAGGLTVGPPGIRIPNTPAPSPPSLNLPTFTWNSANYPSPCIWRPSVVPCGTGTANPDPAAELNAYWNARRSGFSGHHRVTACPAPFDAIGCGTVGTVTLGERWTAAGDATIVSDGPVILSRDWDGAGTLVVVSYATGAAAITMSNNVTLPATVKVLLYAPNGCVDFINQKSFQGVTYAKCVTVGNNFELTRAEISAPGFDWNTFSATHFDVQASSFREVPFTP